MNAPIVLVLASGLIFLVTLGGALVPVFFRLGHTRLQMGVSFSAGLMFGLAILSMLPHAMLCVGSIQSVLNLMVIGFLATFFLQRVFHFHAHEINSPQGGKKDDSQAHAVGHTLCEDQHHQVVWIGVLLGLTLHSIMDGVAVGASISLQELGHGSTIGVGTSLAVLLHKPFDAFALSTLLVFAGVSDRKRAVVNLFFAMVTPVSAGLFFTGVTQWIQSNPAWLGYALAFCAGTFLCIACADLLPELQFHQHDRVKLSFCLILGVTVAILLSTICHRHHSHLDLHEGKHPSPNAEVH